MKLKLLVTALALAAAGHANAAIVTSPSGNGELFLSVYDSVAEKSYTRDLGLTIDQFLNTGSVAVASGSTLPFNPSLTPTTVAGNVLSPGYHLIFGADSLLTSFMGANGHLNSGITWGIGAMDSWGTNRYLSTTNAAAATIGTLTNAQLKSFSTVDTYITAVNNMGTHLTGLNGSSTATATDGAAYFLTGSGDKWNQKANFSSMAGVGVAQNFFLLSTVGTGTNTKISVAQYANQYGAATWNLASDGALEYIAPIPEADTWAMFGVGLLAIGAIARRRMSV